MNPLEPETSLAVEASSQHQRSRKRELLVDLGVFLFLMAVALGTWQMLSPQSSPINYLLTRNALPAVPRRPRPETLSPAGFAGRAAEGYRVAQVRPALLEQIPCYCGCYLSDGHQNALDCFRNRHAADCAVCLDIALRAAQLEKQGYASADIKTLIDREFSPRNRQD